MSLDIGEHIDFLLLDRVHDEHVTRFFPDYFDDGRRIWHTTERAFASLVETGWLQLVEPNPGRTQ